MTLQMFATIFITVFVAELGDKTQLATVLYAAGGQVSNRLVFIAASSALIASTALGVLMGAWIGAHVSAQTLRYVAGTGFIAIGVWTLIR